MKSIVENLFLGIVTLVLILPLQLKSQSLNEEDNTHVVIPSHDGALVLLFSAFNGHTDKSLSAFQKVIISKQEGNTKHRKVAEVKIPKTESELTARLNDLQPDAARMMDLKSNQELFDLLVGNQMDSIVRYLSNKSIVEALGLSYWDADLKAGSPCVYSLELIDNNGNIVNTSHVETNGVVPEYGLKFKLMKPTITDSLALIDWEVEGANSASHMIFMTANIYKKTRSEYDLYANRFVSALDNQKLSVSFADTLEPGNHYAYYMVLEDWAGNKGVPSDTLFALSYDPDNIRSITELQGTAEESAIRLNWKQLPKETIYTGVEVQKSRNYDSAYVVLDTLPPSADSYLDKKVLKGSAYYYRLRPILLMDNPDDDAVIYAETAVIIDYGDSDGRPAKPEGLQLENMENGAQLSWWTSDELDIYGYTILRGYSADNLEVIGTGVQENTYVDTLISKGYSGPVIYAVQAMNHNQMVSDTSDLISLQVRQAGYVTPPAGLSSKKTHAGVLLRWNDVTRTDDDVAGYVIFRRAVSEIENEYQTLNKELNLLPEFLDTTYDKSVSYEYAVASVDTWGNFSLLSSSTIVDQSGREMELMPPLDLRLRNLKSGIEVSWPKSLSKKQGSYIVYRRVEGADKYERLAEVSIDDKFIDQSVQNDVRYEYHVLHQIGKNSSEPSLTKGIRRSIL